MENYVELHENKKARMNKEKLLYRNWYDKYHKILSQMGYDYDAILKIVSWVDYLITQKDSFRGSHYICQNPFLIKGMTKIFDTEGIKYSLKIEGEVYPYKLKLV